MGMSNTFHNHDFCKHTFYFHFLSHGPLIAESFSIYCIIAILEFKSLQDVQKFAFSSNSIRSLAQTLSCKLVLFQCDYRDHSVLVILYQL